MNEPPTLPASWISILADFLQHEIGVEAMLINPDERKVSLATLGSVDEKLLQERLNALLATLDEEALGQKEEPPAAFHTPGGIMLKSMPNQTLMEKPSCPTAPKLWKWRDYSWPEGDDLEDHSREEWQALARQAAICGIALATATILEWTGTGPPWLRIVFYIVALIFGGMDAAKDAWENIRKRQLDVHFLMLAVAAGAVSIGAWAEGALLLFLFSSSGAMEHYALHRTHKEINALTKSAPKTAHVVLPDGSIVIRAASLLRAGDIIAVKPDESFPADGELIEGKTAADESSLTGESVAVAKEPGSPIFSGTLNMWGTAKVKVTRPAAESALQRIVNLIQKAQHMRAPSQQFTDKFGTTYTVAILGLVVAMFFVWWLALGLHPFVEQGGKRSAFYRAMTLLVVASPCALVLSIPSAILAAIAAGARRGILFRGGAAIEKLAEIDTVAMDKTGTLTTGDMLVEAVESFPPGHEREVAELAVTMEAHSNHPLARAITAYGKKEGIAARDLADFQSLTGKGLRGMVDGQSTYLGRRELMASGAFNEWMKQVPDPPVAVTEVWVATGNLLGRILLKDQIREESKAVMDTLRRENIRTMMLTGDRRAAAEEVAKHLGVQEVRAGLSPEDKLNIITGLAKEGRKVAMVGDGVNDAPSLAAAHVSIAMGGRGSDAALEQSDVALMNDRIEKFLTARSLSKFARSIIRQNLVMALGAVSVMAVWSLFAPVPLTLGVMAHEGSTVLVCLNSLRLLFFK